jgi:regulatory protein
VSKPYTLERSMSYALWLLGRRAYTVAELRGKLEAKEAAPEVVTRVLERLGELRYLDDKGFAEGYVRSRRQRKGPLALRGELRRKGVAEAVADEALSALDPDAQLEAAGALLAKNAWRFASDDPRKAAAKAYAFLARRGFPPDIVREALALGRGEAVLLDEEA